MEFSKEGVGNMFGEELFFDSAFFEIPHDKKKNTNSREACIR